MTRLKTIIVDDEPLALRLMASFLEEIPELEILAKCKNGIEAVDAVLELSPDLMFLDIEMPGLNGFEVIKKIQPELLPMVIFCTAYQRYALDAFDVHAVDYVVKPMDEARGRLAVMRAVARFHDGMHLGENKTSLIGAIDTITSNVAERGPVSKPTSQSSPVFDADSKIAIKDSGSTKMIKQENIGWIDAAGDYMCVHAEGETHIMRCTMKHLLEQLDPSLFKRVHRSTIVNLSSIRQVNPHTKGEYFLLLEGEERIKVSRNYRAAIKSFLASMKPE
jgi:two-component system LytT family response regulator